jgi:hypothetical protein
VLGAFLVILIPLVFAAVWGPLLFLMSVLSGWRRLAEIFPANDLPTGKRFAFQSAKLGWSNYGNCLTIYNSDAGLYISTILPFRLGHPPLFIPWSEMHDVRTSRTLWIEQVAFEVGSPSVATLALSKKIFDGREIAA